MGNTFVSATNYASPTYDKLHKLRWILDEVKERIKAMWSLTQQMTIDESTVMYKGNIVLLGRTCQKSLCILASKYGQLQMQYQNTYKTLRYIAKNKAICMMVMALYLMEVM